MLRSVAAALVLFGLITLATAQTITQTITLQPGWNAVWLEVQPADNATATIFSNQPVSSVWSRAERTSADFIQNASEESFNQSGWLGWFHPSRPESFLGNLFAIQANRAYLIRADAAFTLTVTGRPSLRQPDWVPDKYNLRGFPIDAASPPTFKNFFRHSAAQFNTTQDRLRGVYRLGANGQWGAALNTDLMRSGEACWVFCQGASDYAGPIEVSADLGDGLDYGLVVNELDLTLRNQSSISQTVTIRGLAGAPALSVRQFNPAQGFIWPALPSPYSSSLASGASQMLRLAIRRHDFVDASYGAVLEIKDGAGTRLWASVSAEKYAAATAQQSGAGVRAASFEEAREYAGLWIGTATINAVVEAHSSNPTAPTPTRSEFSLRLLIHVDTTGQSRLLKEVIQLMEDGTYTNDANGVPIEATPPRVVLLTDDRLISQFTPIAVRDGQLVGRRFSSASFDFDNSQTNTLALTGFFGSSNTLSGAIVLTPNSPTNPFRHKYHPDHDNLDPTFQSPAMEAYAVVRSVELAFSETGPPNEPDYGYNTIGGTYREVIGGLNKNDITVRGNFTLTRIATSGALNQ